MYGPRGEGRKREPRAKRGSLSSPPTSFRLLSSSQRGKRGEGRAIPFSYSHSFSSTRGWRRQPRSRSEGTGACMATFTTLNLIEQGKGERGLRVRSGGKRDHDELSPFPPSRTYETFVCNAGSFFHSPLSGTGIRNLFQLPPPHFLLKTGEERTPPLAPPSVLHDHPLQLLKPQNSTMVPQKEKKYPAFYTTPPQ